MMRYLFSISLLLLSTVCYARNVNGNIMIVNQSNYSLTKVNQTSNEMIAWNFPDNIAPSTQALIPVQYDAPLFTWGFGSDYSGQTGYQVTCDNGQVENITIDFVDVAGSIPDFTVSKKGANCVSTQPNEDIGWKRDGIVTLTINNKK